jgi:hypothetical protein
MSLDKFAVVLSSEFLVAEFGEHFVGKAGLCRVADGQSETQIIPDFMLASLLEGYAVAPERSGYPSVLLPIHAELEGVRLIREEAESLCRIEASSLPPFFRRLSALETGGLLIDLSEGRVSFELRPSLAARLGFRDGDRISLGVSHDGSEFCFYYDRQGHEVSGDEDGLSVTFQFDPSLFGVALKADVETHYQFSVPYEIRDSRIHFLKTDITRNYTVLSSEADAPASERAMPQERVERPRAKPETLSIRDRLVSFTGRWMLLFPYG